MFTYRSPKTGIDTKQELINENPMMKDIKPFKTNQVYCPLPHYYESADRLDEIIEEITAILNPEIYTDNKLEFFQQLK